MEWISVKDRLPEEIDGQSKVVLVCATEPWSGDVYGLDLTTNGRWIHDVVTHWMPLPEPPKEGNK